MGIMSSIFGNQLDPRSPDDLFRTLDELKEQQNWQSVIGQLGVVYELATLGTPFQLLLDLRAFDPSDTITIQVQLELFDGDNDNNNDASWVEAESHKLQMLKPDSGAMILHVNDQPVGPRQIAVIEPMWGPWRARVNYTQVYGTSKPARFLVW